MDDIPSDRHHPGDTVFAFGQPALVLAVRENTKHRKYHVHTAQGSFWTSSVDTLQKGRYGDWGGGFKPRGSKESTRFRIEDPGPTAYKESLQHEKDAGIFDPSAAQSTADDLNSGEWGNIDKYFEGLTPDQISRMKVDPHFMMLGSILQQGRPSATGWRWPHETESGGVSYYSESQRQKRKKKGLPDEITKPLDISPAGLRNIPHAELARLIGRTGMYQNDLATHIHNYSHLLKEKYGDNVANMWADDPDYDTLTDRLAEIPGVSDYKKGPMIADILRRTGQISGKNWAPERLRPILDEHTIRMYSRMMTDDPEKQNWLLENSLKGSKKKAIPYFVNFTRAISRDPTMSHAPFWHVAQHYCTNSGDPNCRSCPLGGMCASGGQRMGALKLHDWSDAAIPKHGLDTPHESFKQITPQHGQQAASIPLVRRDKPVNVV